MQKTSEKIFLSMYPFFFFSFVYRFFPSETAVAQFATRLSSALILDSSGAVRANGPENWAI